MLIEILWQIWGLATVWFAGWCWFSLASTHQRTTPPPGYERAWVRYIELMPYGAIYSCELRGDVVDSVIRAAMIDTIWHGPVWKQVQ